MNKGYHIFFRGLVAFVVLLLSINVRGQEDDLKKIALKYKGVDKLLMQQELNYFESYSSNKPVQTSTTTLKKEGAKIYLNAFNQETIIVNDVYLLVDHEAEIMDLKLVDGAQIKNSFDLDLDALKAMSSKVEHKNKKQLACYTFYFEEGEHLKSEIWYDINDYMVKKIVYYVRDIPLEADGTKKAFPPRLEVNIIDYKTEYKLDQTLFDFEKFIVQSDDKIQANNEYKNYQLINNIR